MYIHSVYVLNKNIVKVVTHIVNIFFACQFLSAPLTFALRSFAFLHVGLLYSYICLKMSWFHVMKYVLRFCCCFAYGILIFLPPFVEKTILFLLNCLFYCAKNSWLYLYESVSGFPSLFNWSICLSFPQYHTVLIIVADYIVLKLGMGNMNPLTWFFFQNFVYSSFLSFHITLRSTCWYIQKTLLGFWLRLPWIYVSN